MGNFRASVFIQAAVALTVAILPAGRTGPRAGEVAHFSHELPASMRRKEGSRMLRVFSSGKTDPDFLDLPRLADDLDVHRGATHFAILNGRVIALRCISRGEDHFTAMGTLDLYFDEHAEF